MSPLLIRRAFLAAVLTALFYVFLRSRSGDDADPAPEWPPLAPPEPAVDDEPSWREPIDGRCPDGFPIKAKVGSGIFHVPGGRFYDRTTPERCYADPAAAEADGYRQAKA